jgi:hypothetical protein
VLPLVLVALAASAGDFWREKPPSSWSADEAVELITDSPWAHEETIGWIRKGEPGEDRSPIRSRPGEPLPPPSPPSGRPPSPYEAGPAYGFVSASYLVRWESALPIKQAWVRLKELGELATSHFQAPTPRLPEDRYVVTVKTTRPPDPEPDIFLGLTEEDLRGRAQLKTPAATVHPLDVERTGVGAAAAIHFFFPRLVEGQPLFRLGRQTAEFSFESRHAVLRSKFTIEP